LVFIGFAKSDFCVVIPNKALVNPNHNLTVDRSG
jgi:hypothetical protein